MTSTERNATERPGGGLVITLVVLAVAAAAIAAVMGDALKPMLRYAALGIAATFAIGAAWAAASAQRRWATLLDAAESRPLPAAPAAPSRPSPAAVAPPPTNQRELEAEIERVTRGV